MSRLKVRKYEEVTQNSEEVYSLLMTIINKAKDIVSIFQQMKSQESAKKWLPLNNMILNEQRHRKFILKLELL